jgi:hypothetical protein
MRGQGIAEELLQCALCLEPFNVLERIPKSLCCGHTFCAVCIEEMNRSGMLITCPLRCSLMNDQISINYTVKHIIENLHEQQTNSSSSVGMVSRDEQTELDRLSLQRRNYEEMLRKKERELTETKEQHQDDLIGTGLLAAVGGALLTVGALAISSLIKKSNRPNPHDR